jgi:hypothetical protein
VKALVVGHAEPAGALTSALAEEGLEAELFAVPRPLAERAVEDLARSFLELETRLSGAPSDLAIAVGLGDAPMALAVVAAKLGVPLVAWVEDGRPPNDEVERGERRILDQLADFDAGPVGDGAEVHQAARAIAAWARDRPGADLD